MLYMSGHAGPAKTLWKKVVSGGIRQVANVRAYATWFGDRTPRKKTANGRDHHPFAVRLFTVLLRRKPCARDVRAPRP